jgi:hypothetical protein
MISFEDMAKRTLRQAQASFRRIVEILTAGDNTLGFIIKVGEHAARAEGRRSAEIAVSGAEPTGGADLVG